MPEAALDDLKDFICRMTKEIGSPRRLIRLYDFTYRLWIKEIPVAQRITKEAK